MTFGELAKWAEIRNWGQRRRNELTSWLSRIGTARRRGSGRHLGAAVRGSHFPNAVPYLFDEHAVRRAAAGLADPEPAPHPGQRVARNV